MGEVALCAGRADGLSRQGSRENRHAHWRDLRWPALSRRRRQALALGHFQPAEKDGWFHLSASARAGLADRARLCSGGHARWKEASAPAHSSGLCRHQLLRRIPDGQPRVSRSPSPRHGFVGSLFALCAAQYRRLQPAGDGAALHGQEYRQRQSGGAAGGLARKRRVSCFRPRR